MTGLLGAVQFLTRIPIRMRRRGAAPADRSVVPLRRCVDRRGRRRRRSRNGRTRAVRRGGDLLAVLAGLLITGAFHEDGLADVADAFGGGTTPERRFEILKDSTARHVRRRRPVRVDRAACDRHRLDPIPVRRCSPDSWPPTRSAARRLWRRCFAVPPASEAGLGADHSRQLPHRRPCSALLSVWVPPLLAIGWWMVWVIPLAMLATAAVCVLAIRKIGGLVGDALGAIEQVVECVVLVDRRRSGDPARRLVGLARNGHARPSVSPGSSFGVAFIAWSAVPAIITRYYELIEAGNADHLAMLYAARR